MTTETLHMRTVPLLFGFGEVVLGRGYVAGITISHGRILARDEGPDGWWLDGVNPGGIADGAATLGEAVAKFRERFRAVLSELAEEATSFASYERSVRSFFEETDEETVSEWDQARAEVRRIQPTLLDLRIDTFDARKMSISVREIRQPRENPVQESAPAVAA